MTRAWPSRGARCIGHAAERDTRRGVSGLGAGFVRSARLRWKKSGTVRCAARHRIAGTRRDARSTSVLDAGAGSDETVLGGRTIRVAKALDAVTCSDVAEQVERRALLVGLARQQTVGAYADQPRVAVAVLHAVDATSESAITHLLARAGERVRARSERDARVQNALAVLGTIVRRDAFDASSIRRIADGLRTRFAAVQAVSAGDWGSPAVANDGRSVRISAFGVLGPSGVRGFAVRRSRFGVTPHRRPGRVASRARGEKRCTGENLRALPRERATEHRFG